MNNKSTTPPDFTERDIDLRVLNHAKNRSHNWTVNCAECLELNVMIRETEFSVDKVSANISSTQLVSNCHDFTEQARQLAEKIVGCLVDRGVLNPESALMEVGSIADVVQSFAFEAEQRGSADYSCCEHESGRDGHGPNCCVHGDGVNDPMQTWCDHCSGDLEQPVPEVKGRTTTHLICEKCYRKLAGPRWFDPDFDPTKGSPVAPWLTEQARQLALKIFGGANLNNTIAERAIRDIASFASEAEQRGQTIGVERAAEIADKYQIPDDIVIPTLKAQNLTAKAISGQIRALSPDPYFLDRVRAEAATAALEQERNRILEAISKLPFSVHNYGLLTREEVIAAIGDDKEDKT